ncbi:discoidin domain-containing protein [Viridibacterium curvum]|uniref:F5/8 type C domain-containing protein n=1 Tax=Viridibacterium curvum TaxID=1101404 RepID=A0ABP9QXT0_9RHOO
MKSMHLKHAAVFAALAASSLVHAAVPGFATATGGGNATPVVASSLSAIQSAIDSYSGTGGLVIQYTGTFDPAPILANICGQWSKAKQEVSISGKSNITILGANGSSANFGIRIKGSSSNIIVRNMTIGLLPGGASDGDAIGIEGTANNIWIDHNELYSRNYKCAGTPGDDTTFDGLIDIKSGATNITVSYNYIHDHAKVSLGGSSDSDVSTVRRVTWAYNRIENIQERGPFNRGGLYHLYNNYYNQILGSGINARVNSNNLIEGNYFENSVNPVVARYSSVIGYWDLRNNNILSPSDFGAYGITWTVDSDTKKNADDWTTTKPFPIALPYTYTVQPALKVKCITLAAAGAGKGLKEAADVVGSCGTSSSSSSATSSSSSSVASSSSSSAVSSSSSSSISSSAPSSSSSSSVSSTPTGTNLALSGSATASGQSGSSRTAAMAKDGNVATRWEASNSSPGSWLSINFSSARTVSSVTLREYLSRVTGHRVEYLSGSSWVTLGSGSSIGAAKSYSFTPVSTTAIRVYFTGASGQPSITEFEVY